MSDSGNIVADKHSTEDDTGKGKLHALARMLVAFFVKVLSLFRLLRSRQDRRLENIYPSDELDLAHNKYSTTEAMSKDATAYMERLQRVELILNQLSRKSAEIPRDKERMLRDSMDRIKNIEFDLQKANKVSNYSHDMILRHHIL